MLSSGCRRTLVLLPVFLSLLTGRVAAGTGAELTVVSVEPTLNTISAATGTSIVFHFDRPVNKATITPDSLSAFGRWSGPVTGTFSFADSDQTVIFTPARAFSAGERVMVVLSHDAAAADGSPMRSAGYSFLFWTAAAPASLDYQRIVTISTNATPGEHSQPYGGTATDMDQDGWLDLTIVNEVSEDLRVFMNPADGSGLLEPFIQPTEAIGNFASPNEAADFDRDGFPDICIANQGSGTVTIALGAGDGTFKSNQEIAVGSNPRGIAVLDVDGDGDIDIINTNFDNSSLTLLLNDGNGGFGTPIAWNASVHRERALTAADMNNDGILDLVIGTRSANRIVVALGTGSGTFTTHSEQVAGGAVWMLVTGDLNGDGNEDVATVNGSTGSADILLGDGNGNLAPPQSIAVDPFAIASDLADLDGDGDLDWVTSSFSGDWLLWTNDGAANFTLQQRFPATATASCTLAFDVDNDGDLDLALIDETADEIIIMRSCGVGAPECACVVADTPVPDPLGIKNRFLSLSGGNPGTLTAIRVTFDALPPPFDLWNGAQLWVSTPVEVSESGASVTPVKGTPNFRAATLQCTGPVFLDWSAFGVVHLFHEGIVPGGAYHVDVISETCDLANALDFSTPLPMTTPIWGDTVLDLAQTPPLPPEGAVNIVDALAVLGRFASVPGAIIKARADLEPNCLDLLINVSDVLSSLAGFVGLPYPFTATAADPCKSMCTNPLP